MANIHDSGYKLLFSNRTIFRQLLETFVDRPWVARLDFSRAETVDKSFVSDHYKETESDLIYRLPLAPTTDGDSQAAGNQPADNQSDGNQSDGNQSDEEQDVYIYVLLEFQSTVDPWMALRMLNYLTNFYMDWIRGHAGATQVPPVFPILLYNGETRWQAAQSMEELIGSEPGLGEYAIRFRYFKIAENEYSAEQLLGIRNIVATLFLAESHYDLEQLTEQLLALFQTEEDKRAVSLFLNWFRQLAAYGRIAPEDYGELAQVYRTTQEVRGMLIKALEQEKERYYREGLEQGIEQGIEQGLEQGLERGRRETLIRLATTLQFRGFSLSEIAEMLGLSGEEAAALLEAGKPAYSDSSRAAE